VLVHLVADYGPGDLAFAEVRQRIALALPGAAVHETPVAPFDTLSAGFCVAQLALTDGPAERMVVHNVAPRRDQPGPRPANEGERFCAGHTRAGVLVVGPNAGFSFSFCAGELPELYYLDIPSGGSQFRSRDLLPHALPGLAAHHRHVVAGPVPAAAVPAVPDSVIAYIDGYGNLKLTLERAPAPAGSRVLVRVGHASATAIVGDGTFAVAEGELALAPGSSGWVRADGSRRCFLELLLRGGSAAQRFGEPAVGTRVEIQPTPSAEGLEAPPSAS
jgi:hypothetical protein